MEEIWKDISGFEGLYQNLGASIRRKSYCGKLEDGTKLEWNYYEEEVK